MKIQYSGKSNEFAPKAIESLRAIDFPSLYYSKRGKRHPIEIYSVSLSEFLSQTNTLIDALIDLDKNSVHLKQGSKWTNKIISITSSWLSSIVNHIDSCVDSLVCCYPVENNSETSKLVRKFRSDIKRHRDDWATIVNFIKHNQGVIRIVYFHWENRFVPGFFIEGVIDSGVIGPEPTIHKNSNTALSFNRSLLKGMCDTLFISSILNGYLTRLKMPRKNEKITAGYGGGNMLDVLSKLSSLPLIFFPDEIVKEAPRIEARLSENQKLSLLIEMPCSRILTSSPPVGCQLATTFSIGEISRTYKLPYFGNPNAA